MEWIQVDSTITRPKRFKGMNAVAVATTAMALLLSIFSTNGVDAWCIRDMPRREAMRSTNDITGGVSSRRHFAGLASALIAGAPLLLDPTRANAAGKDDAEAREKFVAARKELRDLIENYTEISMGGGDAVRNRLGTQGVNSKLFGIQKVLKALTDDAEDLIEYTETMDEFNAYYFQAEGAAYQSMFIEHSSAKGTPESFLKTAKSDILQMEKYMDQLAAQLKL